MRSISPRSMRWTPVSALIKRRLAGAVLTEQGVDLAREQPERHPVEGEHAGERDGDVRASRRSAGPLRRRLGVRHLGSSSLKVSRIVSSATEPRPGARRAPGRGRDGCGSVLTVGECLDGLLLGERGLVGDDPGRHLFAGEHARRRCPSAVVRAAGEHSTMKLILPSASACMPSWTASMVTILMSLPGTRPAASMASMAPRPMSSLWANTRSMSGCAWRNASMTFLPPSRVKSPVCEAMISNFGSVTTLRKPSARSSAGAEPVVPWSSTMFTWSASANSSLTQSPAFSPSRMKSEPRNVLYRPSSSDSIARSVRTTGMPASRASTSTASQPVSTTGEKAMRSTPCWMNWRIDSIWLSCSPWASVNFRSIPASAAASWIDCVFAVRQPLSAPTWAKPIVYPLRSGITIGPPTSAVAAAARVVWRWARGRRGAGDPPPRSRASARTRTP